MTRDEILQLLTVHVASTTPPTRRSFDEKVAFSQCIKEIQLEVVSCPSVVNYVAYLNTLKAYRLSTQIAAAANSYVRTVTKFERDTATFGDISEKEKELTNLLAHQNSHMSAANKIYTEEQRWIKPLLYRLNSLLTKEYISDESKEAIRVLIGTIPTSLTGLAISFSSDITIQASGAEAKLYYKTIEIPSSPTVVYGNTVLGSLVKSSKNTIQLDTNTTGSTSSISLTKATYTTPVVTNFSSTKTVVADLVSAIPLDKQDEEIKTCLQVYGLLGVSTTQTEFQELYFDPAVKRSYRSIQNICYKWKHPEIMTYIQKLGFNYVCSKFTSKSSYANLKDATKDIAIFTDTRGALR